MRTLIASLPRTTVDQPHRRLEFAVRSSAGCNLAPFPCLSQLTIVPSHRCEEFPPAERRVNSKSKKTNGVFS